MQEGEEDGEKEEAEADGVFGLWVSWFSMINICSVEWKLNMRFHGYDNVGNFSDIIQLHFLVYHQMLQLSASTAAPASTAAKTEEDSSEEKDSPNAKLVDILLGRSTTQLHLQFGIRNNKTDPMILKNTKVS